MNAALLLCLCHALGAQPETAEAAPPASLLPSPPGPVATALVRGVVLAQGRRAVLPAAMITVDAEPAGESDEAGRFSLAVTPGRHVVQVQQPGFETFTVTLDVPAAGLDVVWRLPPRDGSPTFETVVSPPRAQPSSVALPVEEAARTPGAFGDPLRVIEALPGVSQVVWPLALYAVRGANPGNTGFFVDELRVPAIFHFALGPSVIHPYFLEGVNFYPGGYPAAYSRYASGIMVANTAAAPADAQHGSVDVRLFDAGGIVTTPLGRDGTTLAVAGRFSYTGALLSLFSSRVGLGYGDYQARLDRPTGPGVLTVFAFGSVDRLDIRQSGKTNHAALDFHRLDVRWDGRAGGGRLRAGVTGGLDHARSTLFDAPIEARSRLVGGRLGYTHRLVNGLDLETGADAEVQRFAPNAGMFAGALSDVVRERVVAQPGAHVGVVGRAGDRLVVTPAVRLDAFFERDVQRLALQPRLMVRVRPAGEVWLKAAVGRYAQMASLPVGVPGFDSFDLAGGLQTSTQGSLGVEAPLPGALSLDGSGFVQRYEGLTDVASTFDRDIRRDGYLVRRPGWGYGVETLLRRSSRERISGFASYTLSWSLREFEGGVLGASEWDQRHIANLVGNARLPGGWLVGGRLHAHTGRLYPTYPNSGSAEYVRLPAFTRVDLRAERRFVFDKFTLDAYLELNNAAFACEAISAKVESGQRTYETFCLALPSLGVRGSY